MKLTVVCMGDKMPAWVKTGFEDYAKRISHHMQFQLKELPLMKRSKSNLNQILKKESQVLEKYITNNDHLVVLDVLGKQYDTPALAQRLDFWQQQSKPVCFLLGGPEGIDQHWLNRADECISLSKLTLPHPLARVVLIEQLYRAWSILNNHPYHRE